MNSKMLVQNDGGANLDPAERLPPAGGATPAQRSRRILVVAYSRTGVSRRLAKELVRPLGWPLGRIEEAVPGRAAAGPLQRLLGALLRRRRPAIRYLGPSPREFELVVLVSPASGGRLAEPMRSFVTTRARELPDIAVIPVVGGGAASAAVSEIAELARRVPVLSAAFTPAEVEDGQLEPRLGSIIRTVVKAAASRRDGRAAALLPRPAWAENVPCATEAEDSRAED